MRARWRRDGDDGHAALHGVGVALQDLKDAQDDRELLFARLKTAAERAHITRRNPAAQRLTGQHTLASAAPCLHMTSMTEETCPLCGRTLGDVNVDRHHLVPKTFKGKEQFFVHKICHRKIHSVFTERELLQKYHTWAALQGHPDIHVFIAWVARKPAAFYATTATSNKKKAR